MAGEVCPLCGEHPSRVSRVPGTLIPVVECPNLTRLAFTRIHPDPPGDASRRVG